MTTLLLYYSAGNRYENRKTIHHKFTTPFHYEYKALGQQLKQHLYYNKWNTKLSTCIFWQTLLCDQVCQRATRLEFLPCSLQWKISSMRHRSSRILWGVYYWVSFELSSRRLRLFPTRSDWRLSDRWLRAMGLAIINLPPSSSTTSSPWRVCRFERLAFSASSPLPSWNPAEEHLPESTKLLKNRESAGRLKEACRLSESCSLLLLLPVTKSITRDESLSEKDEWVGASTEGFLAEPRDDETLNTISLCDRLFIHSVISLISASVLLSELTYWVR